MSARQYNKYLWLSNVIHSAGRITFKDIEEKWAHASINEQQESRLPRSTFNAMKLQIEELMGIIIVCDRSTNEYFIENIDQLPQIDHGQITHLHIAKQDHVYVNPCKVQPIRIHIIEEAAGDLRKYPLHPSQHELLPREHSGYAVFDYLMSPTMEFYQQICSMGPNVELISPEWLRKHLRDDAELLYATYVEGCSIKKEYEDHDRIMKENAAEDNENHMP
jgi:hypothetical protein